MDFENFLYDNKGQKRKKTSSAEKHYFLILNKNMIKKSEKRVDEIKNRIMNDVAKNNFNKKYQIKSFIEYKLIKLFCKTLDIKNYELLCCNSFNNNPQLKMNKLVKIIEGEPLGCSCCRDCDRPMTFRNEKTNVLYCYFYNKRKYEC
jgi:uncharacterized protein YaaR (DUF327 family)